MGYPYSDCVCVQGIEHFIDPRLTMPQEEGRDYGTIDLPIWEKEFEQAVALKNEADAEALATAQEEAASIPMDRIVNLVVQKTNLINQGYVRLQAYQINSAYIQLNAVDAAWKNANVSLVLSHSQLQESITIPVLELGKPVSIPSAVLIPGALKIVAIAVNKVGDYSVITTNSLTLQVYDPGFKPIHWPKLKDYDLYFYYQTLVKSLIAEVQELKDNTPVKIQGTLYVTLKNNTDTEKPVKYIPVKYMAIYDKFSLEYNIQDFVLTDLELDSEYTISFKLPNETLGITNISEDEYKNVQTELGSYVFVDNISVNDLSLLPVKVDDISLDLTRIPEILVNIPKDVTITTLKIGIRDLKFNRES